jgi:AraC-like DNA-binding protein
LHKAAKVWWATAQLRRGREPASYVAAGRVRARIEVLRADGWTSSRIARAAGVAPATVCRIRKPTTRWCSRIVARAILAVR